MTLSHKIVASKKLWADMMDEDTGEMDYSQPLTWPDSSKASETNIFHDPLSLRAQQINPPAPKEIAAPWQAPNDHIDLSALQLSPDSSGPSLHQWPQELLDTKSAPDFKRVDTFLEHAIHDAATAAAPRQHLPVITTLLKRVQQHQLWNAHRLIEIAQTLCPVTGKQPPSPETRNFFDAYSAALQAYARKVFDDVKTPRNIKKISEKWIQTSTALLQALLTTWEQLPAETPGRRDVKTVLNTMLEIIGQTCHHIPPVQDALKQRYIELKLPFPDDAHSPLAYFPETGPQLNAVIAAWQAWPKGEPWALLTVFLAVGLTCPDPQQTLEAHVTACQALYRAAPRNPWTVASLLHLCDHINRAEHLESLSAPLLSDVLKMLQEQNDSSLSPATAEDKLQLTIWRINLEARRLSETDTWSKDTMTELETRLTPLKSACEHSMKHSGKHSGALLTIWTETRLLLTEYRMLLQQDNKDQKGGIGPLYCQYHEAAMLLEVLDKGDCPSRAAVHRATVQQFFLQSFYSFTAAKGVASGTKKESSEFQLQSLEKYFTEFEKAFLTMPPLPAVHYSRAMVINLKALSSDPSSFDTAIDLARDLLKKCPGWLGLKQTLGRFIANKIAFFPMEEKERQVWIEQAISLLEAPEKNISLPSHIRKTLIDLYIVQLALAKTPQQAWESYERAITHIQTDLLLFPPLLKACSDALNKCYRGAAASQPERKELYSNLFEETGLKKYFDALCTSADHVMERQKTKHPAAVQIIQAKQKIIVAMLSVMPAHDDWPGAIYLATTYSESLKGASFNVELTLYSAHFFQGNHLLQSLNSASGQDHVKPMLAHYTKAFRYFMEESKHVITASSCMVADVYLEVKTCFQKLGEMWPGQFKTAKKSLEEYLAGFDARPAFKTALRNAFFYKFVFCCNLKAQEQMLKRYKPFAFLTKDDETLLLKLHTSAQTLWAEQDPRKCFSLLQTYEKDKAFCHPSARGIWIRTISHIMELFYPKLSPIINDITSAWLKGEPLPERLSEHYILLWNTLISDIHVPFELIYCFATLILQKPSFGKFHEECKRQLLAGVFQRRPVVPTLMFIEEEFPEFCKAQQTCIHQQLLAALPLDPPDEALACFHHRNKSKTETLEALSAMFLKVKNAQMQIEKAPLDDAIQLFEAADLQQAFAAPPEDIQALRSAIINHLRFRLTEERAKLSVCIKEFKTIPDFPPHILKEYNDKLRFYIEKSLILEKGALISGQKK